MYCGTVCGCEVTVNEMICIEEMRKAVTDKLQNNIETAVQVVSVTEQINMLCVTKCDAVVIVQKKGEQATVKLCGFSYCFGY